MPLYEYRCTKCNHKFEVTHQVGGSAGPCPLCGGSAKRIFSSVGLIFKGSGFHTTDYPKPHASDGAKSEGAGAAPKPTAKSEGASKSSEGASKTEQKD